MYAAMPRTDSSMTTSSRANMSLRRIWDRQDKADGISQGLGQTGNAPVPPPLPHPIAARCTHHHKARRNAGPCCAVRQHHVYKPKAHGQLLVRGVEVGQVGGKQWHGTPTAVDCHELTRPEQEQHQRLHPFQNAGPPCYVDLARFGKGMRGVRAWGARTEAQWGRARQHGPRSGR
jgi:hypothetical protein